LIYENAQERLQLREVQLAEDALILFKGDELSAATTIQKGKTKPRHHTSKMPEFTSAKG